MSKQQQETFSYFDSVAAEWRQKAEGSAGKVNIIAQRNACVSQIREHIDPIKRFLDIGCGTGELVLGIASSGVDSLGVDFAPEMIKICQSKKEEMRGAKSSFLCMSIFDFEEPEEPFDLISALGFIEYISPAELGTLLEKCRRMLRPGGAFVVGSRNRLFNLFSLNDYTVMERKLGTIEALLDEAVALASARDMAAAITAVQAGFQPLPLPDRHPGTGIDVALRYQYTPGELIRNLAAKGLRATDIFPVHFHAVPSAAKDQHVDFHVALANALHKSASDDHRLVPQSSSFVLAARAV